MARRTIAPNRIARRTIAPNRTARRMIACCWTVRPCEHRHINDNGYQQDNTGYPDIIDESIERRLGRPFEMAYNYNLTLEFNNAIIHNGVVTPELVLRTIFYAFFGTMDLPEVVIQPFVEITPPLIEPPLISEWVEPAAESSAESAEQAGSVELVQQVSRYTNSAEKEATRQLFTVHIQKLNQVPFTLGTLTWVKLQRILYNYLNIESESYIIKDNQGYVIGREQVVEEEEIFLMQVPITSNPTL